MAIAFSSAAFLFASTSFVFADDVKSLPQDDRVWGISLVGGALSRLKCL